MERAKNACVAGCICEIERSVSEAIAAGELVLTMRNGIMIALPPDQAQGRK